MERILSIENLGKKFGQVTALSNVTLNVNRGEVFGILGPNGSGKTTTLGIILGVICPGTGSYNWFGNKDRAANRMKIGALLEQPNFYPWLSGENNLRITCTIRGARFSSMEEPMKRAGIWDVRKDPVNTYSLGMKQRLAIAATLIGSPDVLVLDEPTNGIDASGMVDIRNLILDYASTGKTIILASHLLSEVEKICSHVAVLRKGKVLATGEIASVLTPDDCIEVAASDMEKLSDVLTHFEGVKDIKMAGSFFNVTIDKEIHASELNRFLVAHGVYADHLIRKKQDLEKYFIDLLETEH